MRLAAPERPYDAPKRRMRSRLTHAEAYRILGEFSVRTTKMCRTSEAFFPTPEKPLSPNGLLVYKFELAANFLDGPDIFEAMDVAGGYKLPRKAEGK